MGNKYQGFLLQSKNKCLRIYLDELYGKRLTAFVYFCKLIKSN